MKKETKFDLKKVLSQKGMCESELAARLGVSKSYLNAISSGKKNPTIAQLEHIAETLGMTLHISFE